MSKTYILSLEGICVGEDEIENTIRNPLRTIKSTPNRIANSVNDVGRFVKKNATKKLHYELALLRIAQQDWKRSIESLKKAIGHHEKAAQIHFALGIAYFNIDQLESSKKEFLKAQALKHKNADSWIKQLANI